MHSLQNQPLHTRPNTQTPNAAHHTAMAEAFSDLAVKTFAGKEQALAACAEHGCGQQHGYSR